MSSKQREGLADLLGLLAIVAALLDYVRPSLLFLPTIAAGGDTPCHYPTAVYFHQHLLPHGRLHGWYPGAYLGHPLLLYYFPLPFLLMSALAPWLGMPVAFKLGTVIGVFLLPLLTYLSFRLMGFRFPGPLLGAASALLFLLLEENPIWGGTLASTLTGEFSYTYGIGLAVLFLGILYRTYSRGSSPWAAAAALGVTALAHGYAVLWAGLSASYFLYGARRPLRTIKWLLAVAALSFGMVGFWILPLLADWGWTTPYDDAWITVIGRNLFPPLLGPLFAAALLGLAVTLLLARRTGGPDHRLLFLLHSALIAALLTAAGPALGIIDVRFAPFGQLALCLAGAAAFGLLFQHAKVREPLGLAFVLLIIVGGDMSSKFLRYWVEWNYTGLEGKELWLAFSRLTERLKGTVSDPRVAVEYSPEHERAGSIRMYEMLPFFTGRSTLEGVYNQTSLMTHPVYYLASELGEKSPNPFRSRDYSRFDTDGALRHLRLLGVRDIVAVSSTLSSSLEARRDVGRAGRIPPYTLFRMNGPDPAYVEPLAYAPVRSSPRGWRDKAYRWFTRKPLSPAHLVFSDDARFPVAETDEFLPPPEVPLEGGVSVSETMDLESLTIRTSRVGHPLLVRISFHPRWRAFGADGPYLVSPALMMIVPRQPEVRLVYSRTAADWLGLTLTSGVLAFGAATVLRGRRRQSPAARGAGTEALDFGPPPRRWGALVPLALVLALACPRVVDAARGLMIRKGIVRSREAIVAKELFEKASRAYSAGRYGDAAEYARNALRAAEGSSLHAELLCLRAEALLRAGHPEQAVQSLETLLTDEPRGPCAPQALFGTIEAWTALGDAEAARRARERLLREFPETPWAERARLLK